MDRIDGWMIVLIILFAVAVVAWVVEWIFIERDQDWMRREDDDEWP